MGINMKKIVKRKTQNSIEAYRIHSVCNCDMNAYTNCLFSSGFMLAFDGVLKHTANNYHK
ncbi:MAG: hypothetical protein LBV33_00735 [Lachnospiraceae bacterium]|jgi:hypothetical protein|nr:hypothetical protein [Lachnospiraceae bacterium]